jgi:hypothetical protein
VRGEVRDPVFDRGVIGAVVNATEGRHVVTGSDGRFDLGKVPANVPVWIRVEEPGFLPMITGVTPDRDTTLEFELVPDPVAVKVIERQKARIDERAADLRYEGKSVFDRPQLVQSGDDSMDRYITRELGTRLSRRVHCWVLDERADAGATEDIRTVPPQDVEYVEILRIGMNKLIVRIYTRDFILSMVGRPDALVPTQELKDLMDGSRIRDCK